LNPAARSRAQGTSVRILGIDPGSLITGFGLVDVLGSVTKPVEWGGIKTSGDHCERLRDIFDAVGKIVVEFRPDEIAIERVFVHRNPDSALKLGQARAAALCATFGADIPVFEYATRHIKKAVVGAGAAEKTQVQHMVRMILGIREEIQPDAADALAAAICHAHQRGTRVLIDRVAGHA
jgi:crossover junction endodeoxyribonuclease RuvC